MMRMLSHHSFWNTDTIMKILILFQQKNLIYISQPDLSTISLSLVKRSLDYCKIQLYLHLQIQPQQLKKYYNSETTVQFQVQLHLSSMTTIPPLMSLQDLHCANMDRKSNPRKRVR